MKEEEEELPAVPLRTILLNFLNLVEKCESQRNGGGIDLYDKEFQELKQFSENLKSDPFYSCKEGEKSVNRKKNRYKDILPFDFSRVSLSNENNGSEIENDYVNANYIKGASGSSAYIACQGPLPHTVNDFWKMVVECEVQVIVMACMEQESGKHKCENYWVEEDGVEREFGDVKVWLKKCRNVCPDFLVRTMRIRFKNQRGETEERNVCQFHYSAWPDHGVPTKVRPLLDMVRLIRDCQTSETLPVLVHCSAGCGRTGTICAIDYVWGLLRLGKLSGDFSLFKLVREMRRQRIAMVQTKDQYILVHRAVRELFQEQLEIIEAHPYANVDYNGIPFPPEPLYETIETKVEEKSEDVVDGKEKKVSLLRKPSINKLKSFFEKGKKESRFGLSRAKSDLTASHRFYSLISSSSSEEKKKEEKIKSKKPTILSKPSLNIKRSKSLKIHSLETPLRISSKAYEGQKTEKVEKNIRRESEVPLIPSQKIDKIEKTSTRVLSPLLARPIVRKRKPVAVHQYTNFPLPVNLKQNSSESSSSLTSNEAVAIRQPKSILKGSLSSNSSESSEGASNPTALVTISSVPTGKFGVRLTSRRNSFRQAVWKEASDGVDFGKSGSYSRPKDYEPIWPTPSYHVEGSKYGEYFGGSKRGGGRVSNNEYVELDKVGQSLKVSSEGEEYLKSSSYETRVEEIQNLLDELKRDGGKSMRNNKMSSESRGDRSCFPFRVKDGKEGFYAPLSSEGQMPIPPPRTKGRKQVNGDSERALNSNSPIYSNHGLLTQKLKVIKSESSSNMKLHEGHLMPKQQYL